MKKKFQFFYPKCDIIRTNARFLTSAKISFQVQSKYIPSLLDFRSKHRRNFPPFLGIIWGAAYLTPPSRRRLTYIPAAGSLQSGRDPVHRVGICGEKFWNCKPRNNVTLSALAAEISVANCIYMFYTLI